MALVLVMFQLVFLFAGCSGEAGQAAVPGAGEAQGLVYNASQQTWHDDVGTALAAAGEGDALYLYGDARTGALAAGAGGVTLDLQGHAVEVDARGSGARGGQGLAHEGIALGSGDNAVRNGSISVTLGGSPETAQSATAGYRGVSVADGGSLRMEGVRLSVAYGGDSSIQPAVELAGIDAPGAVALADGTRIAVVAAPADGSFGASTAAGVHARGDAGDVTLDADSAIDVRNNALQVTQGAVGYPSAIMGTTKESNVELVEIAVDPELDWYDDLLQRFLANAQFDDRGDDAGLVYGAELYYAPALELGNGLMVWAFSDPVDAQGAGRLESIVPAHVFVRSDYALPLEAYGIWCDAGRAGTVRQEGAVSVKTGAGHAAGVYAGAQMACELDEGRIDAACGIGAFRVSTGAFDLADFIDLPVSQGDPVVYPQQSTYTAVRQGSPAACAQATAGEEPWAPSAEPLAFAELFADRDELGSAPADDGGGEEQTVGLTLSYYRMGREGYLYTGDDAGSYVYAPGLDFMPVANERVAVGDVVDVGGVQYRFLGWSPRKSDKQPLYAEHLYVQEGNWGSFGAKLEYYGIYEEVRGEQAAAPVAAGSADVAPVAPAAEPIAASSSDAAAAAADPASPAGGIAVLAAFALAVAAACALWRSRGRDLARVDVDAARPRLAPSTRAGEQAAGWKGGVRF